MAFFIDGPVEVKRIHELTSESDLAGCEFITDKAADPNSKKAAASLVAGQTNHNDLLGLQGGQAGEYYHLTAAQYTLLGSRIESNDTLNYLDFEAVGEEGNAFMELDTGNKFIISNGVSDKFSVDLAGTVLIAGNNGLKRGGTENTSIMNFTTSFPTGIQNTLIGYFAGKIIGSGNFNTITGSSAGASISSGSGNTLFGTACQASGNYSNNTLFGAFAGQIITGASNVAVGYKSGKYLSTKGVTLGFESGNQGVATQGNINIGYISGKYETANNVLLIGSAWNVGLTTEAGQRAEAIIYGNMSPTTANQILTINAALKVSQIKSGATQAAAGAAINEVWKTASHATLPDNVLLIGV